MSYYFVAAFVGILTMVSILKASQYQSEVNQKIEIAERNIQERDTSLTKCQSEGTKKDMEIEALRNSLAEMAEDSINTVDQILQLQEDLKKARDDLALAATLKDQLKEFEDKLDDEPQNIAAPVVDASDKGDTDADTAAEVADDADGAAADVVAADTAGSDTAGSDTAGADAAAADVVAAAEHTATADSDEAKHAAAENAAAVAEADLHEDAAASSA